MCMFFDPGYVLVIIHGVGRGEGKEGKEPQKMVQRPSKMKKKIGILTGFLDLGKKTPELGSEEGRTP